VSVPGEPDVPTGILPIVRGFVRQRCSAVDLKDLLPNCSVAGMQRSCANRVDGSQRPLQRSSLSYGRISVAERLLPRAGTGSVIW